MLPLDPSSAETPTNGRSAHETSAQAVRASVPAQAPPAPPPALNAPPGLEAFTRALTHRLKIVLVFGTLALLFGGAAAWIVTPNRFIAQAHVQLSNRARESNEEFINYQRTQITILKS